MTFLSARIATSISVIVFTFFFLIMISGLYAVTAVSLCAPHSTTLPHCVCVCARVCARGGACVRACHLSVLPMHTPVLCISNTVAVHQLCRVQLSTRSSPNCAILRLFRLSIDSSCCLHNRHLLSVSSFQILFLNRPY